MENGERNGKKRKREPEAWSRKKVKTSRDAGQAYCTSSGKQVPQRQQQRVNCHCRCFELFSDAELKTIFKSFNDIGNHEKQNIYLRGCVKVVSDKKIRRRSHKDKEHKRKTYTYSVSASSRTAMICKASFLGLHGIKESRLKRKVLNFSENILDGRGKHGQHSCMDGNIRQRVHEHIASFPARESHYSCSQHQRRKYLDAKLSIKELHRIFQQDNPDLSGKVLYSFYRYVFNHDFCISFGFPRSDICDTCEKHTADMQTAKRNGEKEEFRQLNIAHELHVRKADVFNMQLVELTEKMNAEDELTTMVIAMDFKKSLPLPKTGISQEYYKRQLWLHNFCIHDNLSHRAKMFLYAGPYAGKGPNEVISCLKYYISTLPPTVSKLHIFADNCFSQNKNRYILAYFNCLVNDPGNHLSEVHLHYPISGHSRMPGDRDFGFIEKKKSKIDRVIKPSEWVSLVQTANYRDPFDIIYVEHPLPDDMGGDSTPIITVFDYKGLLDPLIKAVEDISKFRGVFFKKGENPMSRVTMTGECTDKVSLLKRGIKQTQVNAAFRTVVRAYRDFLPIKPAKLHDVKSLLQYADPLPE